MRTYRLCRRVLMFHHFENEPNFGLNCAVRSAYLASASPPSDPTQPFYSKEHYYHGIRASLSQESETRIQAGPKFRGLRGEPQATKWAIVRSARDSSKPAKVAGLLRRSDRASLKEIMKSAGWLAHSVNGMDFKGIVISCGRAHNNEC